MAPHVLVADDDAWILRMVATVLEKRGYSVETAVDGEDALQRALARTPDLLITDVMMPKMDGWSLVRQLRSHAELALLPVIFLTALSSEDDRIRGFRLGADDYVTKPFRFEELDLRVAKTLRRAQQSQQDTRDQLAGSGLRGDLSQVGLSSLLVLIEMERKTGLLQMRAPGGPSGQILVREGKVVHARLDDQEEPVDAECVYYMLTWGAGEFEFIACVVEGVDRVSVSTTHLLMEGARLMDEANEPSVNPAVTIPPRVSQEFPAVRPEDLQEEPSSDAASASNDGASASSEAATPSTTASTSSTASTPSTAASTPSTAASTPSTAAPTDASASNAEPPSSDAAASPGTLSSMWTLADDALEESPSAEAHASAEGANDAPTVIPGVPARASSPAIPSAAPSESNDAPTVIPGLPARASSPSISSSSSRASSPSITSSTRESSPSIASPSSRESSPSISSSNARESSSSRASSPAIPRTSTSERSRASSPALAANEGSASLESSPAIPRTSTSERRRGSSPALGANEGSASRQSSPAMPRTSTKDRSRASSPALSGEGSDSRASSPAIPPIPSLPNRKSTPSIPAEKPGSGPQPAVDDPADDWE